MSEPSEPYRVPAPPPPEPPPPVPTQVYPTLLWGLATLVLGPIGLIVGFSVGFVLGGRGNTAGVTLAMILGPSLALAAFVPVVLSVRRIRAATVESRGSMIAGVVIGGIVSTVLALIGVLLPVVVSMGSPGRPYRVLGRAVRGRTRLASGWRRGPEPDVATASEDERAALADRWERAGADEHASIAAFARLSLDLLAVGAPAELVARCHEAALDEIAHARGCFTMASAYAGASRGPGPIEPVVLAARPSLASIAAESVVDGCMNEGLAAVHAREELSRATDPVERALHAKIVEDEDRHAALAEDIVRFCIARGGSRAREAAERAFERSRPRALPASVLERTRSALDALP